MLLSGQLQFKKMVSLFALILFGVALYNGLQVTTYTIDTDQAVSGSEIRLLVLTDLHSHIYWPQQRPLIQKIVALDPDMILLVGDIEDDVTPHLGTTLLLRGIKDVAPIFYVTGNHEWWSGEIDSVLNRMRQVGVRVLQGEVITQKVGENTILLAGVDDPAASVYTNGKIQLEEQLDALSGKVYEGSLTILMAHRPEEIKRYLNRGFDLIVSGHAHGGQVQIPFLKKGLYAPNQGFFPQYTQGVTSYGQTQHVISRGLSFNWKLPRVFNRPEVLLIRIQGR